jgi:hypothetical protein
LAQAILAQAILALGWLTERVIGAL